MLRHLQLILTLVVTLESATTPATARSAMPAEDRWNPQHIEGLPAEIRSAIVKYAHLCGGPLAAEHGFALYFRRGATNLIGLHFEHLRCDDRAVVCSARGCLHQVYGSTGGPYHLLSSSYVPELDLTQVKLPR